MKKNCWTWSCCQSYNLHNFPCCMKVACKELIWLFSGQYTSLDSNIPCFCHSCIAGFMHYFSQSLLTVLRVLSQRLLYKVNDWKDTAVSLAACVKLMCALLRFCILFSYQNPKVNPIPIFFFFCKMKKICIISLICIC